MSTPTPTTSPAERAALRWTPEARLGSAIRALEEHGHLLTEEQMLRVRRVLAAPR